MPPTCGRERWYAVPRGVRDLRFERADYQTSDNQTSDWHCAWNLFLTYGWIHGAGGFRGSARNDRSARASDFGFEGAPFYKSAACRTFVKWK